MSLFSNIFKKHAPVNYKELVKHGARIIDVRSKGEFESGHVSGAKNVPLDTIASQLEKFGKKSDVIIVCCASGGRSGMAKHVLHGLGYTNVHNGGGWQSLQKELQ